MEYHIDETAFWTWCHDNGYHNKDYVLDNLAELEEKYLEDL